MIWTERCRIKRSPWPILLFLGVVVDRDRPDDDTLARGEASVLDRYVQERLALLLFDCRCQAGLARVPQSASSGIDRDEQPDPKTGNPREKPPPFSRSRAHRIS